MSYSPFLAWKSMLTLSLICGRSNSEVLISTFGAFSLYAFSISLVASQDGWPASPIIERVTGPPDLAAGAVCAAGCAAVGAGAAAGAAGLAASAGLLSAGLAGADGLLDTLPQAATMGS